MTAALRTADAGPLDDAQAAHTRGDYATELRLLRPLGEQGNAEAQEALGTPYVMGGAVSQDYIEAVKWFREDVALIPAGIVFSLALATARKSVSRGHTRRVG